MIRTEEAMENSLEKLFNKFHIVVSSFPTNHHCQVVALLLLLLANSDDPPTTCVPMLSQLAVFKPLKSSIP